MTFYERHPLMRIGSFSKRAHFRSVLGLPVENMGRFVGGQRVATPCQGSGAGGDGEGHRRPFAVHG